jgi:hypothetical protein
LNNKSSDLERDGQKQGRQHPPIPSTYAQRNSNPKKSLTQKKTKKEKEKLNPPLQSSPA